MATRVRKAIRAAPRNQAARTLFRDEDSRVETPRTGPRTSELFSIFHCDAFEWLDSAAACSIEAVVTDPPYGLIEYTNDELRKKKLGKGGVWRIPPAFDGCQRSPLPRFTVLSSHDHDRLREFFAQLGERLMRVMVPGAHLFIATNPLVSYLVYEPLIQAGFEKRGEIIRLVQTLRGGDRQHRHRSTTVSGSETSGIGAESQTDRLPGK